MRPHSIILGFVLIIILVAIVCLASILLTNRALAEEPTVEDPQKVETSAGDRAYARALLAEAGADASRRSLDKTVVYQGTRAYTVSAPRGSGTRYISRSSRRDFGRRKRGKN